MLYVVLVIHLYFSFCAIKSKNNISNKLRLFWIVISFFGGFIGFLLVLNYINDKALIKKKIIITTLT